MKNEVIIDAFSEKKITSDTCFLRKHFCKINTINFIKDCQLIILLNFFFPRTSIMRTLKIWPEHHSCKMIIIIFFIELQSVKVSKLNSFSISTYILYFSPSSVQSYGNHRIICKSGWLFQSFKMQDTIYSFNNKLFIPLNKRLFIASKRNDLFHVKGIKYLVKSKGRHHCEILFMVLVADY